VIFAVSPAMERFELAVQGYKARPVTFTLRQPQPTGTPTPATSGATGVGVAHDIRLRAGD
jgi:hypothetical protein